MSCGDEPCRCAPGTAYQCHGGAHDGMKRREPTRRELCSEQFGAVRREPREPIGGHWQAKRRLLSDSSVTTSFRFDVLTLYQATMPVVDCKGTFDGEARRRMLVEWPACRDSGTPLRELDRNSVIPGPHLMLRASGRALISGAHEDLPAVTADEYDHVRKRLRHSERRGTSCATWYGNRDSAHGYFPHIHRANRSTVND
jgi:hypothetical protein